MILVCDGLEGHNTLMACNFSICSITGHTNGIYMYSLNSCVINHAQMSRTDGGRTINVCLLFPPMM